MIKYPFCEVRISKKPLITIGKGIAIAITMVVGIALLLLALWGIGWLMVHSTTGPLAWGIACSSDYVGAGWGVIGCLTIIVFASKALYWLGNRLCEGFRNAWQLAKYKCRED